ncbi:MAG: hypothetical protein J1E29_05985 [Duncaniella sp.]|nr:hypothetical protein [Duncaniella sp.]
MTDREGIIKPETWVADMQEGKIRRVLVILKEAPCRKTFNLVKHISEDGSRGNTYNNVAMWVFLLQNFKSDNVTTSYKEAIKLKTAEGRTKCLVHAAIINISDNWQKSADGKHTNDKILFENHTAERQQDIEDFIYQIEPDIILCGGKVVVKSLHKFREKPVKLPTTSTKYAKAYAYRIKDIIFPFISMPHPNAHISQKDMYKDLLSLLDKIQLPKIVNPNEEA